MRRWRAYRAACLAGLAAVMAMAGAPRPARACVISTRVQVPAPAMQATDHNAPVLPAIQTLQVMRGHAGESDGCEVTASSCDDIGRIILTAAATDDHTPPVNIGYRFEVVAGAAPDGLSLPAPGAAFEPADDGTVTLWWEDGAVDVQDPIDVTFQITAVDLAGNASVPQTVRLQHRTPSGGCLVAGPYAAGAAAPTLWLGVAVAVALVAALGRGRRRDPRRSRASGLR